MSVYGLDVDLGAEEDAVAGVDPPVSLACKHVHGLLQRGLGAVPHGDFSQRLGRPRAQFEVVSRSRQRCRT